MTRNRVRRPRTVPKNAETHRFLTSGLFVRKLLASRSRAGSAARWLGLVTTSGTSERLAGRRRANP